MPDRKAASMNDRYLGYTDTLNKMFKLVKILKYGSNWVNLSREVTG